MCWKDGHLGLEQNVLLLGQEILVGRRGLGGSWLLLGVVGHRCLRAVGRLCRRYRARLLTRDRAEAIRRAKRQSPDVRPDESVTTGGTPLPSKAMVFASVIVSPLASTTRNECLPSESCTELGIGIGVLEASM